MKRQTSIGTCKLCGKGFSRLSMTRHVTACGLPGPKPRAVSPPAKHTANASFHLFVEGSYAKAYWMHLAVPADASLSVVDAFLRQIWLECCNHLSAFTIEGRRYSFQPSEEEEQSGMEVPLGRVLRPGIAFSYVYDYGSTTHLNLKILGLWERGTPRGTVQLLAQNDPPAITCDHCHTQLATEICTQCAFRNGGWLCAGCAEAHDCGGEMRLPVVNSPRVGVCGYSG